jgi:hypothetical protein
MPMQVSQLPPEQRFGTLTDAVRCIRAEGIKVVLLTKPGGDDSAIEADIFDEVAHTMA